METMHPEIYAHWIAPFERGEVVRESATFRLAVNEQLDEDERVQILVRPERTSVLVTPAVRDLPGVAEAEAEEALRAALLASGIPLNGPDHLFFLDDATKQQLQQSENPSHVRRLTSADAAAFETFEGAVSEEDLDGASVELDHWMVFGAFAGDALVAVGSSYPFDDGVALADMGVVSHPAHRGQGHARSVIYALARGALAANHEPQYRCQIDNTSSVQLATRSGFTSIGTWDLPLPDTAD
ncbi:GNAT family N-acetyltransferase [Leucobacter sp. M11]|uniref:GNAT family N-acetyltransferase n=1 Tax=Leucobacter sp. M11 TaxID=2993565 RepID=UPI002D7FD28A|nr:GNAT family N-acetyltransferase [Leucobacter sp. M11]MEB4613124.1 GNAT family N-acetyltransferase [Leucobacter sp. M11]